MRPRRPPGRSRQGSQTVTLATAGRAARGLSPAAGERDLSSGPARRLGGCRCGIPASVSRACGFRCKTRPCWRALPPCWCEAHVRPGETEPFHAAHRFVVGAQQQGVRPHPCGIALPPGRSPHSPDPAAAGLPGPGHRWGSAQTRSRPHGFPLLVPGHRATPAHLAPPDQIGRVLPVERGDRQQAGPGGQLHHLDEGATGFGPAVKQVMAAAPRAPTAAAEPEKAQGISQ